MRKHASTLTHQTHSMHTRTHVSMDEKKIRKKFRVLIPLMHLHRGGCTGRPRFSEKAAFPWPIGSWIRPRTRCRKFTRTGLRSCLRWMAIRLRLARSLSLLEPSSGTHHHQRIIHGVSFFRPASCVARNSRHGNVHCALTVRFSDSLCFIQHLNCPPSECCPDQI
jgi:hypothetical protein